MEAELAGCKEGGDEVLTKCGTGVPCLPPASAHQAGMCPVAQELQRTHMLQGCGYHLELIGSHTSLLREHPKKLRVGSDF